MQFVKNWITDHAIFDDFGSKFDPIIWNSALIKSNKGLVSRITPKIIYF